MKKFQNPDFPILLHYFPLWNSSNKVSRNCCEQLLINNISSHKFLIFNLIFLLFQFHFNLYTEVCRVKKDAPIEEFDGVKRIWLKVHDIDIQLYNEHYKPTLYNTDCKILTTEQYVPPYLKSFGEYKTA